jgi:hypothetical protein
MPAPLYARHRWGVPAAPVYVVATAAVVALSAFARVAEVSFTDAEQVAQSSSVLLGLCFLDLWRIGAAILIARNFMERGLIVRVRSNLVVHETADGRRLRVDNRTWKASEVRRLSTYVVETPRVHLQEPMYFVAGPGSYAPLMLLMSGCVIVVYSALSPDQARSEAAKLTAALQLKKAPVSCPLPSYWMLPSLWFTLRSAAGAALFIASFNTDAWTGGAIAAITLLLDALVVIVGVSRRDSLRREMRAAGCFG